MEYKTRAKNRKLKRYIIQTFELTKFKWFHLSFWAKLTTFWSIVILISLLFQWVSSTDTSVWANAFRAWSWGVWFTLLILSICMLFLIFSFHKKEKLKLGADLSFRDYNAIIISGVICVILSLHSYIFISWFQAFSLTIIPWKWPIIALVWGIFLTFWGFIVKKETKTSWRWVIFSDVENKDDEEISQNNMRLPF